MHMAHRDVKPENILVTADNRYKIGDLDNVKYKNNKTKEKSMFVGTFSFTAPELLKAFKLMKENTTYNCYKADVFSLGMCLLYMLTFRKFMLKERLAMINEKGKFVSEIKSLRK